MWRCREISDFSASEEELRPEITQGRFISQKPTKAGKYHVIRPNAALLLNTFNMAP